jgi:hypothetical protein
VPAKAEKPPPNSDSASPVAYWLVLSQITRPPKMAASSAPAAMPAAKPATAAAGVHHRGKTGQRGAQHHAFGAQVDDAGLFVDQQAQRSHGQHGAGVERRGDAMRRTPSRDATRRRRDFERGYFLAGADLEGVARSAAGVNLTR